MQLPDPFRVDLLSQRHAPATALEQRLLHLPQRALPLVREVTLYSGELPLVRARSVIPRPTESGVGRPLTRLGTRPLGAALFSDPRVRRGDIRIGYTRFPGEAESAALWVRHCQFLIAGEAILVSEYFLPACLNLWAPPNPHPPIAGGRFERARH
jgi:chorismate--pyruvate lyase